MIRLHLSNQTYFHPEVVAFYKTFAEIVSYEEADIIVKSDFEPIETDKTVATNTTGTEHITSEDIISLYDSDLSDLTAVPELCMWALLELVRHKGKQELRGKTLGIIGFGRIGKEFSRLTDSFGMLSLVYDIGFGSLAEVLDRDIVSLHITADIGNKRFMDREKFEQMKKGSWFLNSARPWLVDEEALKWALDNRLAGAWFDFDMPKHKNLITTPHIGGSTPESLWKSQMIIAKKVKARYNK